MAQGQGGLGVRPTLRGPLLQYRMLLGLPRQPRASQGNLSALPNTMSNRNNLHNDSALSTQDSNLQHGSRTHTCNSSELRPGQGWTLTCTKRLRTQDVNKRLKTQAYFKSGSGRNEKEKRVYAGRRHDGSLWDRSSGIWLANTSLYRSRCPQLFRRT